MTKHKPWNLEIFRGFDSAFSEDQLVVNQPIRDFLDREDKFILLGAKGLGKTLFLRYKSFLYHQHYGDSIQFNESQTELVECLNIHPYTFSKEELLRFRDESTWRLIWELALWIHLFRLIKAPLNPQLEKLIESSQQLSTILTYLLNNRKKVEQYRTFVSEFQNQKNKIQSAIVLFIDDVDQTLQSFLDEYHPTDAFYENSHNPSVEVWVNAQVGLIGAIYNLSRQNGHIKIYAAIRREAFEAYEGQMKMNYQQHISRLEYNKSEIQQIFENNIQMIDPQHLFNPEGNSLISKFVGYDIMPHRFAADPAGNLRKEEVFNFIYRHTYGRPREIVLMGQNIQGLVSSPNYRSASESDRFELLRAVVNKVSYDIFQQYKREIIPYWDEVKLNQLISNVRSNVIPREEFLKLDIPTLRLFHSLGLLGYVRPASHDGKLRQVFNPAATYNYLDYKNLPNTDFLVIHSSLDTLLLEQHTYGNFYNAFNIIGDGYDFYPRVNSAVHEPEYYLPSDISGNRFSAPNGSGGHGFPLGEIFRNFFAFENAISRHERFQTQWDMAGKVLGLLARMCYCHRLEKQFKTGYYSKRKEAILSELSQYNYMRPYNSEIPDDNSDTAFLRFQDKLFGRYIVLGCYLVLDLRVEWIHAFLTRGRMYLDKIDGKKDTSFSYLSRSFFIRELRREEPRDPFNPEHRHLKQRIFNYLSPFEQQSLRDFIRNATDEVHYLSWVETPEHKAWIAEHIFRHMWRPE